MRILLTNDDGVYAAGIRALAVALHGKHEVTIAAPSAAAQAIPSHAANLG